VQLYHERVSHRVSEAQKIIRRVRRLGVFIKQRDLADDGLWNKMIGKLPSDEATRKDVELLPEGYLSIVPDDSAALTLQGTIEFKKELAAMVDHGVYHRLQSLIGQCLPVLLILDSDRHFPCPR
jgi:hypothetical protein